MSEVTRFGDQFLWTEKYRPQEIKDVILPEDLKRTFQQFVDNKAVPNLLLVGSQGVGKTTVAVAMLKELDCDYIIINASLHGNIDTLRNEILNYASSISFSGGRKYVILDESDRMSVDTQQALRNFTETYSSNCGFILTANFKNKIIEPLHSRCSVIDFKISKKDMAKLAGQFFKRVQMILEKESITYDKKAVAEVIQKYFPDWRRVLNELQRYSATGTIDSGILTNLQEVSLNDLIKMMKDKKFNDIRKWVAENFEDSASFYRSFYDTANEYFKPNYVPQLILTIARYQYQSAFSVDQDINTVAFLVEVMCEMECL